VSVMCLWMSGPAEAGATELEREFVSLFLNNETWERSLLFKKKITSHGEDIEVRYVVSS
jgi:hypothetical protein